MEGMFSYLISYKRTRTLLIKALKSPRSLLNLLLVLISYAFRCQKALGQPVVLDVEPVNTCNFRCSHCPVSNAGVTKKILSLKDFQAVLSVFPHALRIKLQGMGEPFLNKDLFDLIELTASRGLWCEVTTNGSILDLDKLRSLEQFTNFQLTVSIDAADKETFENLRPGSNFQDIIDNLESLAKRTKLNIAAWMLVSEENKDQVEGVIKLLSEINVHVLGLQMLVVDYGRKALNPKTVGKRVSCEDLGVYYDSLKIIARQCSNKLSISDKLYTKRHPCPWPWFGVFVDVSGNVIPCCRISDASICNMGNINEVAFDEIWNSTAYKDFRLQHKNNKIPKFCKSCYT